MKSALIGAGYWGKNLLRVLNSLGSLSVVYEMDEKTLKPLKSNTLYNNIEFKDDYTEGLSRKDIQAVVIATPPDTHYELAKSFLLAGKHVFVEKPMTVSSSDAESLIKLAKDNNKVLMVGHTFLYTPEIRYIKEFIDSGELGDVKYIHASRLNLGKFQKSNVIMDLAPHDIAIFNYLLSDTASSVLTNGYSFLNKEVIEVAFLNFNYTSGVVCNLHLSWLDPKKVRTTTIVGSKKMIVYDMMSEEKIKVYDKGVKDVEITSFGDYLLGYRLGDIVSPQTGVWEPLQEEISHFLECCSTGRVPLSDGKNGRDVVKVLETALKSSNTGVWEDV